MSQSRLTINCLPQYATDMGKLLDFLHKLDPVAVVVVIDNMSAKGLVQQIQAAVPKARVIARCIIVVHDGGVQKELDGGMHLAPQAPGDTNHYIVSPDNFLNTWHELGENGLILSYFNEPTIAKASDGDIARQVAHMVETITKATTRSISLCVGNWGAGHFLTPAFDDVLRLLSQYRQHALGIHVYSPIDSTKALDTIVNRCADLSIPVPNIHITEFGFDSANGSKANGYKSQGYNGGDFAVWETQKLTVDYRGYFMGHGLQSVATFVWGGEASWKSYNVENDTQWQNVILSNQAKLSIYPVIAPPVTPPTVPSVTISLNLLNSVIASQQTILDELNAIAKLAK